MTTNSIPRLEGGGAAPGIDLLARLVVASGVPVADLLPTRPETDDLAASRQRVKKLFDDLIRREDRAALLVVAQVLSRLVEATGH